MSRRFVRLSDLLSEPVRNGHSPTCGDTPTGRWVLGLGALTEHGLDPRQIKPAPIDDSSFQRALLRPGDFLVSRSNTRDKVGRAAMWRGEVECCTYPDLMMRFRIDSALIDPEYLDCYLRSSAARRHFESSASGTSGSMVKIAKRAVETLAIPLPQMEEQRRIAAVLGTWDAAKDAIDRLVEQKRLARLSAASTLLEGVHGGVSRVGDVCSLSKGGGLAKSDVTPGGAHPCILYGELHTVYGEVISEVRSRTNATDSVSSEDGDVLLPSSSETREDLASASALRIGGVLIGGDISILRARKRGTYNPDYLACYLTHARRREIARLAQGYSIVHLYGRDIAGLEVVFPPIAEQSAIASALTTMSKEISALTDLGGRYVQQRRGIESRLFNHGRPACPTSLCEVVL